MSHPLYISIEDLSLCPGLFKENYWPFIDSMKIPEINENEFRHYLAAVAHDREQYVDLDIRMADKVIPSLHFEELDKYHPIGAPTLLQ